MREHKYKAYHKERKVIRDVVSINFEHELLYVRSDPREPYSHWIWQFEDIELMEYTGLRDKNYVEIYEGDIVKFDGYKDRQDEGIYYVYYYEGNFMITRSTGELIAGHFFQRGEDIEVIGNIYQDKHLLEG